MRLSERFVISELTGGLGNQLFQYAAAYALALRESRRLYFAWHLHHNSTARSFLLDRYVLGSNVCPIPLGRAQLCWLGLRSPLANRKAGPWWRRLRGRAVQQLREPSFAYTQLGSSQQRVALDGYFQSSRYFADHAEEVRAGLRLAVPLRAESTSLLREIASRNAVCVHVRRGDYVSSAQTAAFHGALDRSYYQRALTALGPALDNATLYLFSDDPEFCRAEMRFDLPTVIVAPQKPDQPWEDLHLMSACRHFVIANSSFSWWGAWLGIHEGKRVVAPARWFLDSEHDTRDLCPSEWIRL